MWLRRCCREFGIEQKDSTIIECDSQIAIRFTEEHCESERSKHWDAEYQLIREEVGQRESVAVKFVESAWCCADVLTKPVTRTLFERHSRRLLGEEWLFEGEDDEDLTLRRPKRKADRPRAAPGRQDPSTDDK